MPASETIVTRHFSPSVFGSGWRQPCLGLVAVPIHGDHVHCPNVLVIEDLREGDIWACAICHAKHEFYCEVAAGPGGFVKYGLVRLLEGDHVRSKGEPSILEFVE